MLFLKLKYAQKKKVSIKRVGVFKHLYTLFKHITNIKLETLCNSQTLVKAQYLYLALQQ